MPPLEIPPRPTSPSSQNPSRPSSRSPSRPLSPPVAEQQTEQPPLQTNSEIRFSTPQYAPIHTNINRPRASRPRLLSIDSGASQHPSIRIRRQSSFQRTTSHSNLAASAAAQPRTSITPDPVRNAQVDGLERNVSTRRRSSSEPQRSYWDSPEFRVRGSAPGAPQSYMPEIVESSSNLEPPVPVRRSRSRLFRSPSSSRAITPEIPVEEEYESNLVDILDLVDPEVSTLNTLTNVQNSLFVPQLGRFINRRPTYTLTPRPPDREPPPPPSPPEVPPHDTAEEETEMEGQTTLERMDTLTSITSRPTEGHYAVLPHGINLDGWSAEDRKELNDHVRHMLHSKRSKFKRGMKGFGQYASRPLGFFVTLYATLITLFGLAWVLFLIGWINVGGRQDYLVDVIDNVLVALFAIMGDGLAPFRAVDTYHMCFIAHYHHLTWRLRKEQSLPKLQNRNDLPPLQETDIEAGGKDEEYSVLTPEQQKRLVHHQNKFSNSHTFYKPHETTTHHAFPLRFLVAIVCLLDCHSLLQISLGTCTWAISYHRRPFALTTVILCCSITCNITAGVLISVGDRRTRKKDVLERMHKQELTAEAMEKVKKKREKVRHNRLLGEAVSPALSTENSKPLPDSPNGESTEPLSVPNSQSSQTN